MREYIKPTMEGEVFAANEYIAACGESGVVYKFTCTAGWIEHTLFGDVRVGGRVYQETNGEPGLQTDWFGGDKFLSLSYHPCDEYHEAESTDGFLKGYLVNDKHGQMDVIIWRGPDGRNVHCTENLNQDSWETVKS